MVFFNLDTRPKSDVVSRMMAIKLERKLPADCFIGWDMQPLPPGWEPIVPDLNDLFRGRMFWRYWKEGDDDQLYSDLSADYESSREGDN